MANQADQIQQVVCETIRTEIDLLRTFIDRRIAELSTDVHATSLLMDFSESNLSGQLSGIREQITRVISQPAAATRNSGLDLEAVVQATEDAANRIMEAAEAIGELMRDGSQDLALRSRVDEKVNVIFEACSFQDVTGQRIRRTIQHLQHVEAMLSEMVPDDETSPLVRVAVDAPYNNAGSVTPEQAAANPDLGQDAVDSLFD